MARKVCAGLGRSAAIWPTKLGKANHPQANTPNATNPAAKNGACQVKVVARVMPIGMPRIEARANEVMTTPNARPRRSTGIASATTAMTNDPKTPPQAPAMIRMITIQP